MANPPDGTRRTDIAKATLVCGADSDYPPKGSRCNNWTSVPLLEGVGNDMTFDAPGWSVVFDDDEPTVRCPRHTDAPNCTRSTP